MRQFCKIPSVLLIFSSILCTTTLYATTSSMSNMIAKEASSAELGNYWTPERLKNAKPLPLPLADEKNVKATDIFTGNPENGDGGLPSQDAKPNLNNLLYTPTSSPISKTSSFDRGTYKQDYTSSRLVPITADLTYPYRAVGKLFFTIPGQGNFVCSAAVLRPRVVVTAGHCVHKGSDGSNGFYTNFLFVPAFRDGVAPFYSWSYRYVATTSTWATGLGKVPNAADYAMLEMGDRVINDVTRTISWITGYFGWQTLSLLPNHAHLLGYPCNLDSCQKMHQVTAQSARATTANNVEYGSDMRGGSSGGPWVQNFGALAVGQTGGTNPGLNRIIGVTSYGYVDTAPKAQGASLPDSRFVSLLNFICAHRAGNC